MSLCEDFHRATKYAQESIASHPGIDWSTKPATSKAFCPGKRVDLSGHLLLCEEPATGLPALRQTLPPGFGLGHLSTLLLHTYGVTAVMSDGDDEVYFRAAPSAGALYPNEIYVAVRDVEDLPDGIYNYQVSDHALAPVCEGAFWGDLGHLTFGHPAVAEARCLILVSAVFERSVWRYRDRGYRRVLLDTGHLLGNLARIGEALDLQAVPLGGFDDLGLANLLLLDEDRESMLFAAPLVEGPPRRHASGALASPVIAERREACCFLDLHRAGFVDRAESPRLEHEPRRLPHFDEDHERRPLKAAPLDWRSRVSQTMLLRRSARQFTGEPLSRTDLARILDCAHAPARDERDRPGSLDGLFDLGVLRTFLVVRSVEGLPPGLYAYDPATRSVALWRAGDFGRQICHIALGQELALRAAATVVHVADLRAVAGRYGERGYRYLGMDAGHLGQRINLAAAQLGVGVSGIGGYFDDEVNQLFALHADEAVIYLTVLGRLPSGLHVDLG